MCSGEKIKCAASVVIAMGEGPGGPVGLSESGDGYLLPALDLMGESLGGEKELEEEGDWDGGWRGGLRKGMLGLSSVGMEARCDWSEPAIVSWGTGKVEG